jgi:hypothetical protein
MTGLAVKMGFNRTDTNYIRMLSHRMQIHRTAHAEPQKQCWRLQGNFCPSDKGQFLPDYWKLHRQVQ